MDAPPKGLDWLFYVYFSVLVLTLLWSISLSCLRLSSPGFVLLVSRHALALPEYRT